MSYCHLASWLEACPRYGSSLHFRWIASSSTIQYRSLRFRPHPEGFYHLTQRLSECEKILARLEGSGECVCGRETLLMWLEKTLVNIVRFAMHSSQRDGGTRGLAAAARLFAAEQCNDAKTRPGEAFGSHHRQRTARSRPRRREMHVGIDTSELTPKYHDVSE